MRTNLSLHMITADDLEAGGGTKAGLYVAANDGQISFGIGRVSLFFDGPTEFAAWLTKLNALAADTPCVVEAMNPEPEFAATDVPAAALADYERYCDQLVTFTPDATPATLAAWWARYADNYEAMPMAVGVEGEHNIDGSLCTLTDCEGVHEVSTCPPGSFGLCLEESGGYLCTRPVGHEDEHVASGVHSEHIHGGSVRWPQ